MKGDMLRSAEEPPIIIVVSKRALLSFSLSSRRIAFILESLSCSELYCSSIVALSPLIASSLSWSRRYRV